MSQHAHLLLSDVDADEVIAHQNSDSPRRMDVLDWATLTAQ